MAQNDQNNSGSYKKLAIVVLVLVALLGSVALLLQSTKSKKQEYTYSQIMSFFDNYEVYEYTYDLGTAVLTLKVNGKEEAIEYIVPSTALFIDELQGNEESYRQEYNKRHPDAPLTEDYYRAADNSFLMSWLPLIVAFVLMIAVFFIMMRQLGGGGKISNFGKANVKNQGGKKKITFESVAGADEEKEELTEIVDFLKHPKKYNEIGARIPKGVLLKGPPGTGKTLLAKAVAGEAGVPFFSISGSDFVEMYVGVGASRVRDLFEQAKKNAPAIIFIDEIDAVGRHRGAGLGGGHDEREQTLNQLLVEMDGFEGNEGIIVMAATNRDDILDPALLRPGRFDRQIDVGYPDIKGREEILKVHAKNKPLAPDVNLKEIAQSTAMFTGADLENLLNEAALLAARHNRKAVTKKDIEEATIKVIAGPEKKSKVVTEESRKLTAFHEAGHAVATYYCKSQDKVHQVTIIPRGNAGGMTIHRPETDRDFLPKTYIQENIIVLLGGRVAEKLVLDDISTGASNDIERASHAARAMVMRYGFSEKLGPIVYGSSRNEVFLGRDYGSAKDYSENVAAEIDEEVREIIEEAYEKCKDILEAHMDQLHQLAEYLLSNEKIDGPVFEQLMSGELDTTKKDDIIETTAQPAEDAAETVTDEKAKSDETDIEKQD